MKESFSWNEVVRGGGVIFWSSLCGRWVRISTIFVAKKRRDAMSTGAVRVNISAYALAYFAYVRADWLTLMRKKRKSFPGLRESST